MLFDKLWRTGVTILIGFTVGILLSHFIRRNEPDRKHFLVALERDSLLAARDTTRTMQAHVAVLGDSLQVVMRRAVQTAQRADELDRAIGVERVMRDRLQARIVGLNATVRSDTVFTAVTAAHDAVRRGVFVVREAPYTARAEVELPAAPAVGRLRLRVELDTLGVEVRVGCGVRDAAGVRAATATVIAPKWVEVQLARVEQGIGVCSPMPRSPSLIARMIGRVGVSVGYGMVRDAVGVGVLAGVRVWP
jgi:hypothetical protein